MERHEHAKIVQNAAEDTVIDLLQDAGYRVTRPPYPRTFDITINGQIRVEIKGALWTKHKRSKGRYQFNTRQNADIYVLVCLTHAPRCFVIPGSKIGARANVAIWSEYPSKYTGQWAEYCDNWNVIDQALGR